MISIIICSRNSRNHNILSQNIKDTIGCIYELIIINNQDNSYSIFEAYNMGVKMAKYSNLVFMHEDILFRTSNWGTMICSAFSNKNDAIGVIGVIGSPIVMDLSYGWWEGVPHVGSVIQNKSTAKFTHNDTYDVIESLELEDAIVCDGLFLAFPRDIFNYISFDTKTYNGFHCYDLDICMQAICLGYKVKVINNILLEHYSEGKPDRKFAESMFEFYKKWKTKLPIYCDGIDSSEVSIIRDGAIKLFMESVAFSVEMNNVMTKKGWRVFLLIFYFVHNIVAKLFKRKKFPYISN